MKSSRKTKAIILITIGINFTFLSLFINIDLDMSSNYRDEFLDLSAVSGKIVIINNSGWVAFRSTGNCTGNGTYSEPYVIEDLVIDGEDSGSCILIENSGVYFKIENCTIYNSYAGIRLSNVSNSLIITNNCSSNSNGILLWRCSWHSQGMSEMPKGGIS